MAAAAAAAATLTSLDADFTTCSDDLEYLFLSKASFKEI
jgi:hypothetical protein